MTNRMKIAACLAAALTIGGHAHAQTPGGGPGQGMGPGMMQGQGMGPGMMQGQAPYAERGRMRDERHMMGRICFSQDAIAPRLIERFERTTQPKPEQRTEFEALKTAATKAEQTLKAACPTDAERADRTPTARMARAEKHAVAMADAIKAVRPAFDAYYAKLDDKQRDRVRWAGAMWGEGRGYDRDEWRDRREERRGDRPGPGQGPGPGGQR
jgi:hypothetical protein